MVVACETSLFDIDSPSLFDLKTFCLFSNFSELDFDGKDLAFNFVMACVSVDKLLNAKKTCRLRIIV